MRAVFITLVLLTLSSWAAADRGGVLFYAGFEGTADATAAGNGIAQGEQGGPKFAPGKRGQALLSGEGAGYVSYAVERNLLPDRGTVEFWVCPQDWAGTDEKFHVFFEAENPGWLLVYKYFAPGSGLFLISETHQSWSTLGQDFSQFRPGQWHHLAATWSARQICFYLDGKPSTRLPRPPIPLGLSGRFMVGDRPWHIKRDARSLVDELYIYDRPLSEREVGWAYEHAADRPAGEDVPEGLAPAVEIMVRPVPSRREIRVDVDVNQRGAPSPFSGTASLEPSAGTSPATLRMTSKQTGEAVIPFRELPAGEYQVRVTVRDDRGRKIGAASQALTSPGPPVWRGNTIGISETPPPPWTPLKVEVRGAGSTRRPVSVSCWGRSYRLDPQGLPHQMTSAGAALLARPVQLRVGADGKPVRWCPRTSRVIEQSAVRARMTGSMESDLGALEWTCTAEFDGMLRYDLTLHPVSGAVADSMELRVPLDPAHATLYHAVMTPYNTGRGAVPAGQGAVLKANWAMYWWLGDEERGLAGFCESDEAWDRIDRPDGFRIERTPGSVDAVWSFIDSGAGAQHAVPLREWRFTFGLQATPVKDITGWRKWRLTPGVDANVHILWPTTDVIRYYGYPQATDPAKYAALVKDYHAKRIGVVPYSLLNAISSQSPEWSFYGDEWANGAADTGSSDVVAYKGSIYGCSPSQTWIDFVVWANERYVREFDLDGLYHDWTMVFPSSNQASGCGYLREGKLRPTYPVFGIRELYKRIYTMLKQRGSTTGKDMFMMGHMSSQMVIPILSFCDSYLDAEHFRGLVKDNYLEVMPLDQIRAEFMGHNWGVMPFFLPEFTGEYAEKPEPTQHLVGLSLLHDFALWPIWCKTDEVNRIYRLLDEFGIVDAEFLPYWNNGRVVGGQSDAVKCSAYRKPGGGALICAVNLTRQPQTAALTVEWERLTQSASVSVVDAVSKEPVPVRGGSVSVVIQPLNFRLLWVR
jgi:hypothetical protein